MMNDPKKMLDKVYSNFIEEAELFFVTRFIDSQKIKNEYQYCLDVLFNISGTKDTTKGLIAFNSNYGQGKSFFFDVVHHRIKRTQNRNLWKRVTARELCEVYTSADAKEDATKKLDKFIQVKHLFIDDIGDELKDGKMKVVYGNKLNVLRYVLLKRYDLWNQKGFKTYGTTNITLNQFAENYDGRLADRIMQMCYWRSFGFLGDGQSFRQIEETRKLTQEEIRKNWLKFQPKKELEPLDLDKYFNSMLNSTEEAIETQSLSFWKFCKTFLISKDLVKEKDFDLVITQERMNAAREKLIYDKRQVIKTEYRHAPAGVFSNQIEQMKASITEEEVKEFAKCNIVKGIFLNLKSKQHKF